MAGHPKLRGIGVFASQVKTKEPGTPTIMWCLRIALLEDNREFQVKLENERHRSLVFSVPTPPILSTRPTCPGATSHPSSLQVTWSQKTPISHFTPLWGGPPDSTPGPALPRVWRSPSPYPCTRPSDTHGDLEP